VKRGEGPGVLEVVEDHDGYTIRFKGVVYVLHCFQKKSRRGIRTPQPDVKVVSLRVKQARQDYEERYGSSKK